MAEFLKKSLGYLAVAVLSAALTMAFFVPRQQQRDKLDEILYLAQQYYVEDVDLEALRDGAAQGIVDALGDRWSYYVSAKDAQSHQEYVNNAYVGVGITVVTKADDPTITVQAVTKGGSAQEAGILPGDVLVRVEDTDCEGLSVDQVRDMVRGEEGTTVRLTVLRDGQMLEFSLQRRTIQTPVAEYEMLPGDIGLISIANFDARCAQETLAAIEELRAMGAKSLIFDVRNNGGGFKDEMVKILDYLLPEGKLFVGQRYDGKQSIDYSDENYLDMPMVVLVNGRSYSAAELFAAALEEYDAAVVVGQQTSGKGYYQVSYQLSDGSLLALSIGKYCTPNGVSLEGVGITPEVMVEVDEETDAAIYYGQLEPMEDPQILAAIEVLTK